MQLVGHIDQIQQQPTTERPAQAGAATAGAVAARAEQPTDPGFPLLLSQRRERSFEASPGAVLCKAHQIRPWEKLDQQPKKVIQQAEASVGQSSPHAGGCTCSMPRFKASAIKASVS